MAETPEPARTSWFTFDHFYSDSAFPVALEVLASRGIRHLADVGANTGRFAIAFLARVANGHVTPCDLPQQLALAREAFGARGLLECTTLRPCDLLDSASTLTFGDAAPDAIWMSQLICCLTEVQIVSLLSRMASAVRERGSIFVLDTFWDDQDNDVAAYCLINTWPYFTAIANGNSRMYRLDLFRSLAQEAGLAIRETWHRQGWCHTLIELSRN